MLLSTHNLIQVLKLYNDDIKRRRKLLDNDGSVFHSFLLVISVTFFIIEIMCLYIAIKVAIVSGKTREERFTHLFLAIIFTIPYLLFSLFLKAPPSSLL